VRFSICRSCFEAESYKHWISGTVTVGGQTDRHNNWVYRH